VIVGFAAILAFIAVWRQDRMAAWLFAPTPLASALNGPIFVLK
jgi:hypothetical protein